jgi:hypothetical protein
MNNDAPTSSGLIIGIILGILIIGGIILYMRGNTGATPANDNASLDVNVKVPTGGNDSGSAPKQ